MDSDITVKKNDNGPILLETLTNADGSTVDLTGASVTFIMRDQVATLPKINSSVGVTIVSNTDPAEVSYSWQTGDTDVSGRFLASFVVVFSSGEQKTYPTEGYIEVLIEEDLITESPIGRIVNLGQVKSWLNIPSTDHDHDAKLLTLIDAATPIIEGIVGAIVQITHDEWYDGGQYFIIPRHFPVVSVQAVTEYQGPIAYTLSSVGDPSEGTIYSFDFEPETGRIVRRSAGGGVAAFPNRPQSVHVIYTSGRSSIPSNVQLATLELIRVNYQQTQQGAARPIFGPGSGNSDEMPDQMMMGFFVPNRVRELLAPDKRAPSIA